MGNRMFLAYPVVAGVLLEYVARNPKEGPAMPKPMPRMMKALVSEKLGELELKEVPVPEPGYNELLVRMKFAPVNPSDIYRAYKENYAGPTVFPHMNGLEGVGVVVKSGGGIVPYGYTNNQIRVMVTAKDGGTWAEYIKVHVTEALPVRSNWTYEQAAAPFVNPATVIMFLEIASAGGHKAMVHTAASSALGLQLLRAAKTDNLTVVCVVRGEKNAKMLTDVGHPADLIVRSDLDDFPASLKAVVDRTGATLAFDAVNGKMAQQVYDAMPEKSENYVYGMLSGEQPPDGLLGRTAPKSMDFLLLPTWLQGSPLRLPKSLYRLYQMLPNELATEFAHKIRLNDKDLLKRLEDYAAHQKGGKMLLQMF